MRIPPLSSLLVFVALMPSLAVCQQYTNCHTPESVGNFVGADEVIVNDMICKKVVKDYPAAQQLTAKQPDPPAPASRKDASGEPSAVITNARVIQLSKLGLDDDILIRAMRNDTNGQFVDEVVERLKLVRLTLAAHEFSYLAWQLQKTNRLTAVGPLFPTHR